MSEEAVIVPAPSPQASSDPAGSPWGAWATIGLFLLILLGAVQAELGIGVAAGLGAFARGERVNAEILGSDGNLMALGTCASGLTALALTLVFAASRKGIALREYLALRRPTRKEVARWTIVFLLLVVAEDLTSTLLGEPIVPEVMVEIFRSVSWALPFLWLAVLVVAPISEEFVFRGFLFQGLQRSRLGTAGAILLISAVWAAIHVQYDLYGMALIFVGGIFLGAVRARTGSLWLCVLLHGLMNVIATIQLLFHLRFTT